MSNASVQSVATCRHCGADLLGAGFSNGEGEKFCCSGCRVVYGILQGQDDGRYYELLSAEKVRAPRGGLSGEYRNFLSAIRESAALRGIGIWRGEMHSLNLECSDMQCAACGWLMERILGKMDGVMDYAVDFIHGEIHLSYDSARIKLPDILAEIGTYGYAFKPRTQSAARPSLDRAAWMRLAVAAACFMNAMAFSLGPYMGMAQGMSSDWRRMMGLWSFMAALPAVFYSAFPFYQGAWRAIRSRIFTIDVTVTIGVAIAFAVSFASILDGRIANYSDTLSGLVFFLLLGRYAVRRFEGGLSLRNQWHESLSPGTVRTQRDGLFRWVQLEDVREEDLVEIDPDSYLPVDGEAISDDGEIDTAFLTGEDRPRAYKKGDFLFAGYRVLGKPLQVRVVNPHKRTRAATLRHALESMAVRKQRRNLRREGIALAFTLTVIAFALAAFFMHRHEGWSKALEISASVFIVSCSCSLALAVPISRGVGLLRAHRLGFHFRDQEALERISRVQSAIFDKTGTLTFTQRKVSRWHWVSVEADLRQPVLTGLERLTRMSCHSVSTAIHSSLAEASGEISGFTEIPHFGIQGIFKNGATSLHLCLCRYGAWNEAAGSFYALGLKVPFAIELPQDEEPPRSCLFVDGKLSAFIWLTEELKPGVHSLIRHLGELGIPALLLSGDHEDRVRNFAVRSGFHDFHGGLSPEEKQMEARRFQWHHGPALAVGDGFNDSLLFGESEVAVAVQGAAGPMAEEADVFMTSSNPESLLGLLRISKGVRRSLRNCHVVSAVYNVIAISLAVNGVVSPLFAAILMPLASLSLCATAWLSIPRR